MYAQSNYEVVIAIEFDALEYIHIYIHIHLFTERAMNRELQGPDPAAVGKLDAATKAMGTDRFNTIDTPLH